MSNQSEHLVQRCRAIHDGGGEAIRWVGDVRRDSQRLDRESDSLIDKLRRVRNLCGRLGRADARPVSVGFFGLSQAGKSYLISAMAAGTGGELETDLDGERLNYDISLKGGYYTGNYGLAGLNFNYYQRKFIGEVFRNPDTLQSNTISRGYAFTPYFRSSVPLTDNERLSFFTEVGLTFGFGNSLRRTTKNLDEVDKTYSSDFNFRIGISPGITFFAMESFAFEIQLNVLGYELQVSDQSVNEGEESR